MYLNFDIDHWIDRKRLGAPKATWGGGGGGGGGAAIYEGHFIILCQQNF